MKNNPLSIVMLLVFFLLNVACSDDINSGSNLRNTETTKPIVSSIISSAEKKVLTERLIASSKNGEYAQVKELIKQGADVNGFDYKGFSPLIRAALNNHYEIVKYLVNHGANVNFQNNAGYTALHKASYRGYPEIVEYLLKNGANVDSLNSHGSTPLLLSVDFYLAGKLNSIDTISILLDHGANPNLEDSFGGSARSIIVYRMYLIGKNSPRYNSLLRIVDMFDGI